MSAPFNCLDIRLSARDVFPVRAAECNGRGEPEEGGVSCCELPSKAASECYARRQLSAS